MNQDQGAGPSSGMTQEQQGAMLKNYQFSREELKVLSECNRESFYQRSLPLSTVMGLATFYGVKNGFLKRNIRFGAAPKATLAVVMGYFLGKVSYQRKCAEKLMALPGSFVGQVLRDRQNQGVFGGSGFDTTPGLSVFGNTNTDVYSDVYKDAGPNSSLDLDTDRPLFRGLDDTYKPSLDNQVVEHNNDEALTKRPGLSYDELRKKNREEQIINRQQPFKLDRAPPISRPLPEPAKKNIYGDTFDD